MTTMYTCIAQSLHAIIAVSPVVFFALTSALLVTGSSCSASAKFSIARDAVRYGTIIQRGKLTANNICGPPKGRFKDSGGPTGDSPCAQGVCRCTNISADCSQHYGNLSFIPELSDSIIFLNFSFNNITAISTDQFFANVTNITGLDLGSNGLSDVNLAAFGRLRNLRSLCLAFNPYPNITYAALQAVFSVSTLQVLDVGCGTLGTPPNDTFRHSPMRNLTVLYLNSDEITSLNFSMFLPLRMLRSLHVGGNLI